MLEKVIDKVAAFGVPGLVLVIVIATTGLAGGAALVAALAALGGPFGIIGGIAALGLMGLISQAIAKYGVEAVLVGIVRKWLVEGKPKAQIEREIENFPAILLSREMKDRLLKIIRDARI